jgi:hypothetical protein
MNYSFRIRFKIDPTKTLNTELDEIELPKVVADTPLKLISPRKDKSINESEDFGSRAPKGIWTNAGFILRYPGMSLFEELWGEPRVLENVHGLMVYESEPKPKFGSIEVKAVQRLPLSSFIELFRQAVSNQKTLTHQELLSFSLFNSSFFQNSNDSRFLLLMMAIEALLAPPLRSEEAQSHVHQMIKLTKESGLPKDVIDSMIGSLRWLNRESISNTGRMLTKQRIGRKQYYGKNAPAFFTDCYNLRSSLVHGNESFPSYEKISSIVEGLEEMVSDLLTTPFLGEP